MTDYGFAYRALLRLENAAMAMRAALADDHSRMIDRARTELIDAWDNTDAVIDETLYPS